MNTHTPAESTQRVKPFKLRLPPELAERLRRLASAHDRSLNGELVWALRAYVDREEAKGAAAMAREEQQPMSDARLEELKAKNQVKTTIVGGHYWRNQVTANDIDELLAEVERLRAMRRR